MSTFVCFLTPSRTTFPGDATPADLATIEAHFAHLQRQLDAGTLILAGRTDEAPLTGLVIFEAADRPAAEEFVRADPAVAQGLFQARVSSYRLALWRGSAARTTPTGQPDGTEHLTELRALYRYNDWARERVFAAARGLGAAALDQPFDMGPGSLRKVLQHYYGAERFWYERWRGPSRFPPSHTIAELDAVSEHCRTLSAERAAWLETLTMEQLATVHSYPRDQGGVDRLSLRGMLLHVCNHGTHHRAQALNMLRRLGVRPPDIDLDTMLLEESC